MYQMAIIWWIITTMNGGGPEIGTFMVLGALPSILFVKKIGIIIEKVRSKKVFIYSELIGFILVLGILLTVKAGYFKMPAAFAAGFFLSLIQAFIDPTLNKSVPELCDKKDITSGVAFITSTQSLANFGGAIAGAILIERLGIFGVACINGLSYFLAAFFVFWARFDKIKISNEEIQTIGHEKPMEILNQIPLIKKLLIGFGLTNFFFTPILVVLPLYTKKLLLGNASTLASLEACLWVGILLGGFSAKFIRILKNDAIKIVAVALGLIGINLIFSGLVINKIIYMLILLSSGFMLGVLNVKIIDYYQKNVPEKYRGRFFAILAALVSFTFPIAYFFFGFITEVVNIPVICIFQGVGVASLAVYFKILSKQQVLIPYYVKNTP